MPSKDKNDNWKNSKGSVRDKNIQSRVFPFLTMAFVDCIDIHSDYYEEL